MRLKEILKSRGMSAAQLARQANIGQTAMYEAMNGYRSFFPSWRKRICEVLGMEENEVFENEVFPERTKKEE